MDDLEAGILGGGKLYVQAKRTLSVTYSGRGEFSEVIAQLLECVEDDRFDESNDRMMIAVGHETRRLRALREGLRRYQTSVTGSPSSEAASAMSGLVQMLQGSEPRCVQRVLGCTDIAFLNVSEPSIQERCEAWLDGRVVSQGEAVRAWETIHTTVKRLGTERAGANLDEWLQILRDAKLSLIADASGIASQRREAERQAREYYVRSLIERAKFLDVGYLVPGAPPVEVDPDPRQIGVVQDGKEGSWPLDWVLRRVGRIALVGGPGLGKSTAMLRLAAQVGRDPSLLPLLIHLPTAVSDGLTSMNASDRAVEAAIGSAPALIRERLREHALASVRQGTAVILFDSLDECRSRTHEAVSFIREVLSEANGQTSVVIAMRDFAMPTVMGLLSTPSLGFCSQFVRLQPPQEHLVEGLLRHVANHLATNAAIVNVEERVREQLRWTRKHSAATALRTPAMAWSLLALSCFELTEDDEPRGALLSALIERTVRHWEIEARRRGDLRLPALDGIGAEVVLLAAFDTIAGELFHQEPATPARLRGALEGLCRSGFGIPAGLVTAVADEALKFWDEAGVFVSDGTPRRTRARVRFFTEIGYARKIARLSLEEQRNWLRDAILNPAYTEVVLLLTGLSPVAASLAIEECVSAGTREAFVIGVRVVTDRAQLAPQAVELLARNILDAKLGPYDEDWSLICSAAELPVSSETLAQIESISRITFPDPYPTLMQAHVKLAGAGQRPTEEQILELLDVGHAIRGLPSRAGEPKAGVIGKLRLWTPHRFYTRTLLRAAERLPPGLPLVASQLLERGRFSANDLLALGGILRRAGYDEIVSEHFANQYSTIAESVTRWLSESHKAWRQVFAWVTERSSTPAAKDSPAAKGRSRRRLNETCRFISALINRELTGEPFSPIVLRYANYAECAIDVVLELGSFDPTVLSEELDTIDLERDFTVLLQDSLARPTEPLSNWGSRGTDSELFQKVESLLVDSDWLAEIAARALASFPDWAALEPVLWKHMRDARYGEHRRRLAGLLLERTDDVDTVIADWSSCGDSFLVKLAASIVGQQYASEPTGTAHLPRSLVEHPDGAVRAVLLHRAGSRAPGPELLQSVTPPNYWTCNGCGGEYALDAENCAACELARPECRPWLVPVMGTIRWF
ncbi:MAG: AAA family ATPase [Pseudomonadota bacterium]|nr:AAA family ATPase [Pseudomonadota bacterium]